MVTKTKATTNGAATKPKPAPKTKSRGADVPKASMSELEAILSGKRVELEITDPHDEALSILTCRIRGTAPLIMHAFGAKAKEVMVKAQTEPHSEQGGRGKKKQPRVIEDEVLDMLQVHGVRPKTWKEAQSPKKATTYVIPAHWIRLVMCHAAWKRHGIFKGDAATYFWVHASLPDNMIPLQYEGVPEIREDVVRLNDMKKTAMVRYRPNFVEWWLDLEIEFDALQVTPKALLLWLKTAGVIGGLGDYRPEKGPGGRFGTFEIVDGSAYVQLAKK